MTSVSIGAKKTSTFMVSDVHFDELARITEDLVVKVREIAARYPEVIVFSTEPHENRFRSLTGGTCQSPQLVYTDGKPPWLNREIGASHESSRGFWTAPKFGCLHFTKKEEG